MEGVLRLNSQKMHKTLRKSLLNTMCQSYKVPIYINSFKKNVLSTAWPSYLMALCLRPPPVKWNSKCY